LEELKMCKLNYLVLAILLFLAVSAYGAYRLVPSVHPTIQAAIDAAVNGDTVVIAPGIYTGDGNRDIDFLGKAITVRSIDPNDPDIVAATIIDCNGTEAEPHRGFIFQFPNGERPRSIPCPVLAGLTIRNARAPFNSGISRGGGIYCDGSNPMIQSCILRQNMAIEGTAIYSLRGNPTISKCIITENLPSKDQPFTSP